MEVHIQYPFMKVLIVCSGNNRKIAPFIKEQAESLMKSGLDIDYFLVKGKGLLGYWKNRKQLLKKINEFRPDIIHAHYGLSGLLANLQRKIPVVTTYHGSDINNRKILRFSKIAIRLSAYNIFVSQKNIDISGVKKHFALIPCGVDTSLFLPIDKESAKSQMSLEPTKKYVLFAGAFDNRVKNSTLAKEAVSQLNGVELLELKGYNREQVVLLMNAVDAVLMTSFTEGSPQFIKEAMACNCPIVSVNVGDVSDVISGVENCFIADYSPEDIADKLEILLSKQSKTNGREKILQMGLDINAVAKRIMKIYENIAKKI